MDVNTMMEDNLTARVPTIGPDDVLRYIQTRSASLKYLFVFFLLLTNACAGLRLYVRCRLVRIFGADDIFLLATMTCFTMYTFSGLFSIRYGIGSNPHEVDNNKTLSAALEWWFLAELFSVLAAALLRISASLHMRKLAETDAQQWLILFIGTGTTVYSTCFFLLQLFQCTPIHFFWTGWLGAEGRCMDQQSLAKMEYVFTVFGVLTDLALAVVPIWLLWTTDLSRKSRSRIRALVLVGLCAGAAALIRLPATQLLPTTDDFFFDCVPVAVSSILEIGMGMIALSAAAYRPILPGFFDDSNKILTAKLPPPIPEEFRTPTKGYGDLASMTGVQMSPRSASFRKVSEARTRYFV
ncbi:uncharacterized protein LY89DRAFT_686622 [Mollisia scopiformis]|uniref:Rhodopsin domain-containing protein n=1 Tax=Mollisia scopiformis TaxID=149040 RepID=A0A194X4S1_MOLSC|nr:uncharacterized protein LY89DRAFT_686622 [Mollisia scopiformis]KUJ15064.1 hypothetical protein LY89DRAFT_686622 [Mollisia scopiformis]